MDIQESLAEDFCFKMWSQGPKLSFLALHHLFLYLVALTSSQCETANSYSFLEPTYLSREGGAFWNLYVSSKTVEMKESKESDSSWFLFVQYVWSEYFKCPLFHKNWSTHDLFYSHFTGEYMGMELSQKVKWDWCKPQTNSWC